MKIFRLSVPFGEYVFAAESKEQLLDYLETKADGYDLVNIISCDDQRPMSRDEIAERISSEVKLKDSGVTFLGGYVE